jgi:hypothetical protein
MKLRAEPVIDDRTREVILFDMYVDDRWHGSRRTYKQCDEYFKQLEDQAYDQHRATDS